MNQLFCMYMYYTSLVTRMGLTFVYVFATKLLLWDNVKVHVTVQSILLDLLYVLMSLFFIFILIIIIIIFFSGWGGGVGHYQTINHGILALVKAKIKTKTTDGQFNYHDYFVLKIFKMFDSK